MIPQIPTSTTQIPAYEQRQIRKARVMELRSKGYSNHKIAAALDCSVGTVWSAIKEGLQELATMRNELGELILDDTIQSYQRIENIIVARGHINLEAKIKEAEGRLIKARETEGQVSGKTANEWEHEIERLQRLHDETGGLENEDLDRLVTVRDKITKLLGVEPPKKLAVEHTFTMQAQDAQQRLRDKLGIKDPATKIIDEVVIDVEVSESAEPEEVEADPIRS